MDSPFALVFSPKSRKKLGERRRHNTRNRPLVGISVGWDKVHLYALVGYLHLYATVGKTVNVYASIGLLANSGKSGQGKDDVPR